MSGAGDRVLIDETQEGRAQKTTDAVAPSPAGFPEQTGAPSPAGFSSHGSSADTTPPAAERQKQKTEGMQNGDMKQAPENMSDYASNKSDKEKKVLSMNPNDPKKVLIEDNKVDEYKDVTEGDLLKAKDACLTIARIKGIKEDKCEDKRVQYLYTFCMANTDKIDGGSEDLCNQVLQQVIEGKIDASKALPQGTEGSSTSIFSKIGGILGCLIAGAVGIFLAKKLKISPNKLNKLTEKLGLTGMKVPSRAAEDTKLVDGMLNGWFKKDKNSKKIIDDAWNGMFEKLNKDGAPKITREELGKKSEQEKFDLFKKYAEDLGKSESDMKKIEEDVAEKVLKDDANEFDAFKSKRNLHGTIAKYLGFGTFGKGVASMYQTYKESSATIQSASEKKTLPSTDGTPANPNSKEQEVLKAFKDHYTNEYNAMMQSAGFSRPAGQAGNPKPEADKQFKEKYGIDYDSDILGWGNETFRKLEKDDER